MSDFESEPTDPANASNPLTEWWRDTKVAAAFLTRFPVAFDSTAPATLGEAARGFPVVGLVVGAAGALAYGVAIGLALPPTIAALIAISVLVLVTGGLHEDGLADMADGFGGGHDRESILAIMRDSRIGSFGVLALIIVTGLRVLCVAELHGSLRAGVALIAAAAGSRALLPIVLHSLPPARDNGLGHQAGRPARRPMIDAAAVGAAVVVLGLGPFGGMMALAAAAIVALLVASLAKQRLGGQTGDVLGTIQQLAEAAILVAAVATQS